MDLDNEVDFVSRMRGGFSRYAQGDLSGIRFAVREGDLYQ